MTKKYWNKLKNGQIKDELQRNKTTIMEGKI